jgi:hypothetical protein
MNDATPGAEEGMICPRSMKLAFIMCSSLEGVNFSGDLTFLLQ